MVGVSALGTITGKLEVGLIRFNTVVLVMGFLSAIATSSASVAREEVTVPINSVRDVEAWYIEQKFTDFDKHPERLQAVPRTRLHRVPEVFEPEWKDNVNLRISVFYRHFLSAALQVNEEIKADRNKLQNISLNALGQQDRVWLIDRLKYYRVPGEENEEENEIDKGRVAALALRMDEIPPSLVIVQTAIESGWLQSRFARKGQALFGQWSQDGTGIKAKDSDVRLAIFNSPRDSLIAYTRNLNSNKAYRGLWTERADMRARGETLSGFELAKHMKVYAETGQVYVDLIRKMIKRHDLGRADTAKLADGPVYIFKSPE